MENNKKENLIENKFFKFFSGVSITIILGAIGSGIWERFLSKFTDYTISYLAKLISSIFKYYLESLYFGLGKGITEKFSLSSYIFLNSFIIFFIIVYTIFSVRFLNTIKNKIEKIELYENLENIKNEIKELEGFDNLDKNKDSTISAKLKIKEIEDLINNLEKGINKVKDKINFLSILLYYILKHPKLIIIFFSFLVLQTFLTQTSMMITDIYQFKAVIYIERSIEILAPHISNNKFLELMAKYRSIDNLDQFLELDNELIKLSKEKKVEIPKFYTVK